MADSTRVEIFEIEIKNLQSIDELNKQLAEAKKSYKAAQIGTEEYIKAQNDIVAVNAKLGEHKNKLKEVENQSKLNDNTIEGLRAKYKSLTAEIVKTDLGADGLSKEYISLNIEAKKVSDRLKELESGFGNNTRNVGNYKEAMGGAIASSGAFGSSIVGIGTALTASPMGAFVEILGLLFKAFSQNDKIAIAFKGIMDGLGVAISKASSFVVDLFNSLGTLGDKLSPFSSIIAETGNRIINALIAPIMLAINAFSAMKKALDGDVSGALKDAGSAIKTFGKDLTFQNNITNEFIGKAIDLAKSIGGVTNAGIEYNNAMEDLDGLQKGSLVTFAKLNQIIAINEKALKNSTLTYQQQLNILDKIQRTDEERARQKLKLIDLELAAEKKLRDSQGAGSVAYEETNDKILALEAQRIDIQTESLALQEKYEGRRDQFAAAESKRLETLLEKDQEYLAFKRLATDEQLEQSDEVVAKTKDASDLEEEIDKKAADNMATYLAEKKEQEVSDSAAAEKLKQDQIQGTFAVVSGVAQLGRQLAADNFEAQKLISVTEAIINTAKGVTNALGSAPVPFNFILAGITGALGAVQVAKIASAEPPSAAAGGGDFITTKPTMLLVGDNPGGRERVTVTPLSGRGQTRVARNSGLVAMAGGGSLTVDSAGLSQVGGSIGGDVLAQSNISKSIAETMSKIGNPVVSVVDIKRVTKSTDVTESRAKLKA